LNVARDQTVVVIGAGIAGLAAASKLGSAGFSVRILEARNRIGGRIFTTKDNASGMMVPLGAEFIHGRPEEIWQPLQESGIRVEEVRGEAWCVSERGLQRCDFFPQIDFILNKMDDSLPDESFLAFLERQFGNTTENPELAAAKKHALAYVSGFNAADPAKVGVHWLVQEMRAEEHSGGYQTFRSANRYADLIEIFQRQLALHAATIHTDTVVDTVQWSRGQAEVLAHGAQGACRFTARHVVVTLPLSLLKAPRGEVGVVQFFPPLPHSKLEALNKLEMGKVIRIVLLFRQRFWDSLSPRGEQGQSLSNMSFLFSEDEWFPTWWTSMPQRLPMITGWAAFRPAEQLSGQDSSFVVQRSLETLERQLGVSAKVLEDLLESAFFHDWQSDPFSRGAYSYGKVGSDGAQRSLSAAVDNTLFFAGEATHVTGNNGTVHGAIASGYRAAEEILRSEGI
jgi:monoamine oxidase